MGRDTVTNALKGKMTQPIIALLIEAIILHEGRGIERVHARNAREDACGPAQIRPCILADLAEWGYNYEPDARYDPMLARSMARLWLTRRITEAEARTGRELTIREAAQIWGGGPMAYRRDNVKITAYGLGVEHYYNRGTK